MYNQQTFQSQVHVKFDLINYRLMRNNIKKNYIVQKTCWAKFSCKVISRSRDPQSQIQGQSKGRKIIILHITVKPLYNEQSRDPTNCSLNGGVHPRESPRFLYSRFIFRMLLGGCPFNDPGGDYFVTRFLPSLNKAYTYIQRAVERDEIPYPYKGHDAASPIKYNYKIDHSRA